MRCVSCDSHVMFTVNSSAETSNCKSVPSSLDAECSPLIGQTVIVVVIHNTHADFFVYRHTQSVRPELTDSDEHEDLRGLETLMEGEPKQQHRMLGTGGEWERSVRRCGGKCDEVGGRCHTHDNVVKFE